MAVANRKQRRYPTEPLRCFLRRAARAYNYVWTNSVGAKVTHEGHRQFARLYADRYRISFAAAEKELYRVLSAETCTEGIADRMAVFLGLHPALIWEEWYE